jgi:hypothetical protein
MTSARSIDVPRKRWIVVALLVAGFILLLAQNSTVLFPDMDSYVRLDERNIALRVAHAPCSWTRVTEVAETPDEVRIKVDTLPCPIPGPSTGTLAVTYLTVSLADDLGTRVVRDAAGQAVPALAGQETAHALSVSRTGAPKGR